MRPGVVLRFGVFGVFTTLYVVSAVGDDPAAPADLNDRSLAAILAAIDLDARRAIEGRRYASVHEEVKQQAKRYETAAAAGDRVAQFKLGAMHLEGVGMHPNAGVAWQWFIKAGGEEHPLTLVAKGRFYLRCRDGDAAHHSEKGSTIEALGRIGPAAAEAVPILTMYLHDGRTSNYLAAVALARIGERGVPVLVAALDDDDVAVRRAAAYAFAEVESAAAAARESLVAAAQDDDPRVRDGVERALARLKARETAK